MSAGAPLLEPILVVARAARSAFNRERCTENKKKHKIPFDALSDVHVCRICNKPIKQRLVAIKDRPPKLCFGCAKQDRKFRHIAAK